MDTMRLAQLLEVLPATLRQWQARASSGVRPAVTPGRRRGDRSRAIHPSARAGKTIDAAMVAANWQTVAITEIMQRMAAEHRHALRVDITNFTGMFGALMEDLCRADAMVTTLLARFLPGCCM
jgi:hypothetical protein